MTTMLKVAEVLAPPPGSIIGLVRDLPDPLGDDQPSDDVVVTTRRGLVRVALVAAEVGGRFQREGLSHDPMSWMLAPRALFHGAAAIDACTRRDECLRGVLLHGLSLGLDADPDDIDELSCDDGLGCPAVQDLEPAPSLGRGADADMTEGLAADRRGAGSLPLRRDAECEPRLFTATVVSHDGFENVQAFHASLATEEAEVAGRLYCRMGPASADARIVAGFDPADPLVAALVSPAMCDTLALVVENPASPLAAGFDVNIEQRFRA